jgi:hypothetical protein
MRDACYNMQPDRGSMALLGAIRPTWTLMGNVFGEYHAPCPLNTPFKNFALAYVQSFIVFQVLSHQSFLLEVILHPR